MLGLNMNLASLKGIGAMINKLRGSGAFNADYKVRYVNHTSRSRIAGNPGKPGDKIAKRAGSGTLTLRNFCAGNYGEFVRSKLNIDNFKRMQSKKRNKKQWIYNADGKKMYAAN